METSHGDVEINIPLNEINILRFSRKIRTESPCYCDTRNQKVHNVVQSVFLFYKRLK